MTPPEPQHTDPSEAGAGPGAPEPLTPEELARYLARVRLQAEALPAATALPGTTEAEEPAYLDEVALARLSANFYPELGDLAPTSQPRLLNGVIFDLYDTLARLPEPLDDLMARGALAAVDYMRATGMTLPADFDRSLVEARRFAEKKSADEQEEHLADDALSFLLQFFGYPASRMNPDVLRNAVDLFYAPEMTAWRLVPGTDALLQALRAEGYRLALLTNYNCDRVFQRTVDYLGLRPYFDLCLSSASVEYRKPDARFLQIALDQWEVPAYEVAVVGDSLVDDVRGGLDLGALTVLVASAASPQVIHDNAHLQGQIVPDAVAASLSDLPALLRQWT